MMASAISCAGLAMRCERSEHGSDNLGSDGEALDVGWQRQKHNQLNAVVFLRGMARVAYYQIYTLLPAQAQPVRPEGEACY